VPPPPGARRAEEALPDCDDTTGVHILGLPGNVDARIVGRSAEAAVWLARRARETGRAVPSDLVVSAELVDGPAGPCLAPVAAAERKARIVAREMPGARLLLCADADVPAPARRLCAGPVGRELEPHVWPEGTRVDRAELLALAASARDVFEAHDYVAAATLYRRLSTAAGTSDAELRLEAFLRLAAIEVHAGRPERAEEWFRQADLQALPRARAGRFVVERRAVLAGQAIDAFRPQVARRMLEAPESLRAREPEHADAGERMHVLGAWRRLLLLEGDPILARATQRELLPLADGPERARALLDLAWTELRCGDADTAIAVLCAVLPSLPEQAPLLRLQSRGFLAWYAARASDFGARLDPQLNALLAVEMLDALLAEPGLQAAARWRVAALRAVRTDDHDALDRLARGCTPFQRWHLGVFVLRTPLRDAGMALLRDAEVDLGGHAVLEDARAALRAAVDSDAPIDAFERHAVY
jgi:hypothetical protein